MLMEIRSNPFGICMYFPEEEVKEPRRKKEDKVEIEKKQNLHSFIPKR